MIQCNSYTDSKDVVLGFPIEQVRQTRLHPALKDDTDEHIAEQAAALAHDVVYKRVMEVLTKMKEEQAENEVSGTEAEVSGIVGDDANS